MKILHAIATLDPRDGGPVSGLLGMIDALRAYAVHSAVAVLDAPRAPWLVGVPFEVHAFGPAPGTYRRSPRFRRWLHDHAGDFDAVIVHGLWGYQGFAVWRELRGGATPYYVFPHGMLDPWFKRRHPLKHLKKWLYWPWGQYPVLRDARGVLFTCEEERRLARQSFWLYRCREAVAGFGAAPVTGDASAQREAFLKAFPALAGRRLMLFVGRLHPKQACDLLIDAFADQCRNHADVDLVLAGPDPIGWEAALRARVRGHGLESRVCFTGLIEGDVKWGAYRAADVFVLPSHQENFGVVVAEALACGVPVLLSDKVNIWREVLDDGAGMVAPDDVAGTSRLLRDWLALPRERRDSMRERAAASFTARFGMPAFAARFAALLQQDPSTS